MLVSLTKPHEVGTNALRQLWVTRLAFAMPFGGDHLHQLPASCDEASQVARLLTWHDPWFRLHAFGEACWQPRRAAMMQLHVDLRVSGDAVSAASFAAVWGQKNSRRLDAIKRFLMSFLC